MNDTQKNVVGQWGELPKWLQVFVVALYLAAAAFTAWQVREAPWVLLVHFVVLTASLVFAKNLQELTVGADGVSMKLRQMEARVAAYVDGTLRPLVRWNYAQIAAAPFAEPEFPVVERVAVVKELNAHARALGVDGDPQVQRDRAKFKGAVFEELLRYANEGDFSRPPCIGLGSGAIVAQGRRPTVDELTWSARGDQIPVTPEMQRRIQLAYSFYDSGEVPAEVEQYLREKAAQ